MSYRIQNPRCFVLRHVRFDLPVGHHWRPGAHYLRTGHPDSCEVVPGFLAICYRDNATEYPTAAAARAARDADVTSPAAYYRVFRRGRPS